MQLLATVPPDEIIPRSDVCIFTRPTDKGRVIDDLECGPCETRLTNFRRLGGITEEDLDHFELELEGEAWSLKGNKDTHELRTHPLTSSMEVVIAAIGGSRLNPTPEGLVLDFRESDALEAELVAVRAQLDSLPSMPSASPSQRDPRVNLAKAQLQDHEIVRHFEDARRLWNLEAVGDKS